MAQYDIPISMQGGFKALPDAKGHRNVIGKLQQSVELAKSLTSDLKEMDKVELGATPSDLYKDLAPGQGHVIMLSQPEGSPLMGAELDYNTTTGDTKRLVIDMGDSKLTQMGSTFKLEEPNATTFFLQDAQRGTFTVLDPEKEVPRIFSGADPVKLMGGLIQLNHPILLF